jgi:O-Antigen ligase
MPGPNAGRPSYLGLRGYGGAGPLGADTDFPARDRLRAGIRPPAAPTESRRRAPRAVGSQSASGARDTVFALGLLLSPSSQLRPNGSPIGPGEVCLLIWLLLMLGREAARLGPPLTPALSRLLIFWALFAVALSIGTMTAFALQDSHDPVWFLHDVVAYPLLAAVSCLSVVGSDAGPRLHRVAWLLVALGTGSLALQVADAWGLVGVPQSDPWYWDRFRGWSDNPEQLALLCAALGLLTLHLAETAARPGERIAAVACAILPIYVGRLSKTDAFTLVLLAAGPIFIALKFRTWTLLSGRSMTFRSAAAWLAVLALPLVLASGAPLAPSIAAQTAALAKAMSKDHGKTTKQEAELRLQIWSEAWSRGVESGMLGLGPGPHLQIPPSIVAGRVTEEDPPKHILHPAVNGTPNYEAHNVALDLFAQGGLLAVLSFLWLAATTLFNTYKARLAGLTTLLCSLLLYGMSVLIIRHPIFWFAIALCLVVGAGTGCRSQGRGRADGTRGVFGIPLAGGGSPRPAIGGRPNAVSAACPPNRIRLWRGSADMAYGRRPA